MKCGVSQLLWHSYPASHKIEIAFFISLIVHHSHNIRPKLKNVSGPSTWSIFCQVITHRQTDKQPQADTMTENAYTCTQYPI